MRDIEQYEAVAKFDLPDAERQWISKSAGILAESFKALEAVDTSGVLPLCTVLSAHNVMREDVSEKKISREELLWGAPEQYDGYFQAPKTLE